MRLQLDYSRLFAVLSLLLLFGITSAIDGLTYEILECGMVVQDSTIDAENQLDTIFDACDPVSIFGSGDKLYSFTLSEVTDVHITMTILDGANLDLFLLSDDPELQCPASCLMASQTGQSVEFITTQLPAGTYWIAVDGPSSIEGVGEEGYFELALDCGKSYDTIGCNETVFGSTIGKISQINNASYTCLNQVVKVYTAGDQLYRYEALAGENLEILLTNVDADLDLFLMNTDTVDGVICPKECIAYSDNSGLAKDTILLSIVTGGIYWIVVDGDETPSIPFNSKQEGEFLLSINCGEKNYSPIACGDQIFGSTEGKINQVLNDWYGNCADTMVTDYSAGDQLYKLTLDLDQTLTINLSSEAGVEHHLFVFDDMLMDDTVHCPGQCMFDSTGVGEKSITTTLLAGTYWIVVDGDLNSMSGDLPEGEYVLTVDCGKVYENISCDNLNIINSSTANRLSTFDAGDLGNCADTTDNYSGGDRLYKVNKSTDDEFNVSIDSASNLNVFIFSNQTDQELGDCPDTCITMGKNIMLNLDTGIYWILVDGPSEEDFVLTVSCGPPLPISLISFDARLKEEFVELKWTTVSEVNSEKFEIERSNDGITWSKIGEIAAHGFSNHRQDYRFMDMTPHLGQNHYRMKMMDLDGSFEYSDLRSVNYRKGGISVYPSIIEDVTIIARDHAEKATLEVIDLYGKIHMSKNISNIREQISLKELVNGYYYIRISTPDQQTVIPVVKQ